MAFIIRHFLLYFNYVLKYSCKFESSKICIQVQNFLHCLIYILVVIWVTNFEHSFEIWAKTDDIE